MGDAMKIIGLLGAVALMATAAGAQDMSGYWACSSYARTNGPNVAPNPVGMEFQVAVYPDGTAQGQGIELGSSGRFQTAFQARWIVDNGTFVLQGQRQSGMGGGVIVPFTFASSILSNSQMAYNHNPLQGTAIATSCTRQN